MAEKIVNSIFGVDPAMYSQLKNQQNYADALAVGNQYAVPGTMMNPSLGPLYTQAAQQGQLIGGGVGTLLGAQDPELQKITAIKQLSKQFDLTSPTGMREFSRALQQIAPNESIKAAKRADEMTQAMALQTKTYAEAQKALTEKVPKADDEAQRIRLDELKAQYGPQQGARIFRDELIQSKQKVAAAGAGKGSRNVLAVEAKRAESIQKNIDSGYTVLERLAEQENALQQGMIAGTGADARTAIATFAASIGLADPTLIAALANSKSFKANQNALAAAIAKQLGVNPTDKDFQASLAQFAANSDNPQASLLFIKQMRDKFSQRQKINEDMMTSYVESDGTFRNYKGPKMVTSSFSAGPSELENLLAEKARRDAGKK